MNEAVSWNGSETAAYSCTPLAPAWAFFCLPSGSLGLCNGHCLTTYTLHVSMSQPWLAIMRGSLHPVVDRVLLQPASSKHRPS